MSPGTVSLTAVPFLAGPQFTQLESVKAGICVQDDLILGKLFMWLVNPLQLDFDLPMV